jgi:hypothetical protein
LREGERENEIERERAADGKREELLAMRKKERKKERKRE